MLYYAGLDCLCGMKARKKYLWLWVELDGGFKVWTSFVFIHCYLK